MSERNSSKPSANALPPATPADISVFEEKGKYVLRDQEGKALYTYDKDVDGKPHCVDKCALTWPPVLASAGASTAVGDFKSIPRGTARQWTFRGKPIYTFEKDNAGETKGDGVEGVWHLVKL